MDQLPPTQALILEVLALGTGWGEEWWPFPTSMGPGLRALVEAGLISTQGGQVPYTVRACLTEAGRRVALGDGYVSGLDRIRDQYHQALAEVALLHEALLMRRDSITGSRGLRDEGRKAGLEQAARMVQIAQRNMSNPTSERVNLDA